MIHYSRVLMKWSTPVFVCFVLFFAGARLHQFEFIIVIFALRIIFESFSALSRFNQRPCLNVFVGQLVIILWQRFLERIAMMHCCILYGFVRSTKGFLINKGSISFMRVKKNYKGNKCVHNLNFARFRRSVILGIIFSCRFTEIFCSIYKCI